MSKKYPLTIRYAVPVGATAPADYAAEIEWGDAYDVPSPELRRCVPDLVSVSGTMVAGGVEVTVTYAEGANAINPGDNLTAADLANGDLPIEIGGEGFTVKFRTRDPEVNYWLVASPTLEDVDWLDDSLIVDGMRSPALDKSTSESWLISLTAPMDEDGPPVRFFKIRASIEEP